ncbi:hypothetical protein BC835DRAFT_1419600 [Cytidiella melzeri]|nr:hypothetical protein BC835DRAFT_1419600 [Cytidiella melzeri]
MSAPQQLPAYDLRSTTLTPYLQLPHLLSLTWLAYPILSLLFVAFRLQLSSASAQSAVDSAKDTLLTSCQAAEKAATATASMPRYMATATNARIADAVNDTMNGARAALVLSLTVMEAIINFIVDTYRSTFLCFLELVVRGGLSILIGAVQELNNAVGAVASGIRTSIQDAIDVANKAIKIIPGVPQISVPDLTSLQNVTLPQDFQDALTNLNNSLPTLSDLKNSIDDLIDTPFELVKKDINDTFAGLSFDANTLPIPEQNTVTFCDQMDTSVVDDLGRDLIKITKIGIVIIIALALLLLAANCALEWYKWRCLKDHLRYTREAWTTDPAIYHPGGKMNGAPTVQLSDHNLLMLQGNMLHPLLTKLANRMSATFRLSPSKHIHLSWFFHYVFHPPALACFLIGFFGLLSVQIQLLAISPLEHKYQEQALSSANDFSSLIATSINASMYNQSAAYASNINGRVDTVQSTVNDGLFGWVNGTTTTLNNTINAFYNDLQNAVQTVFKGTILESPVEEFIRCFIGSKVDAVEQALTFLHDNLVVDIPRVNDTVLVLSPASVDEATQPIATAAIGGGDGDNQGVVGKLVNAYVDSLKKERIMFSIFIGLWGLVVLMGLAVIWWHSYGRDLLEKYRKRRWEKKQRAGIDGIVIPFRDYNHGQEEKGDAEFGVVAPAPLTRPGLFSNLRSASFTGNKNAMLAPHPYPESNGRPGFDKSWESILDNASGPGPAPAQEPRNTPDISGPRRLMAIHRSGSQASGQSQSAAAQSEMPWLTRFTMKFWRKDATPEEPEHPKPSLTERPRPKLTVTTSNGSVQSINGDGHDNPVPSSAWSVSPRKSTWMSNLTAPKLPTLRPKSRRTVSVPSDIDPSDPDVTFTEAKQGAPFALPLHHGFPVATTPLSPPPPSFQFPAYASPSPTYTNRHLAPPQHPSATKKSFPPGLEPTGHARHNSLANPFATPFDDEHHGATVESPSSERNANPFVGMAM